MKVVVSGARDWTDDVMVSQTLDIVLRQHMASGETGGFLLAHGDCSTGADRHAKQWWVDRRKHLDLPGEGFQMALYPAEWRRWDARKGREYYRPQAGLERTTQMLEDVQPDVVLAFHDAIEFSKGTRHCVEEARRLGLNVWLITHPKKEFPAGPVVCENRWPSQ